MRTITMLLIITSLLVCGLAAPAQQEEGQPGAPTASAVEDAPGQETVESAPGAETAPKQYGGDVNAPAPAPAQPQIVRERVIERRTQVVREIAAAHQQGDQVAVRRLTAELKDLNGRIVAVEANPLGGETGQRSMWRELHAAGVRSESYLREHYGLQPVSASETVGTTPAPVPAAPQGQGGSSMAGVEWLILAFLVVGGIVAICFALRGPDLEGMIQQIAAGAGR
jgi:hypothetical protein